MLDNIIDKNINFLGNHGVKVNDESDKAVYKYGLQVLYYSVIDLLVIFSLALCFGKLYETAIMTVVFGLFQVFGGGYHATTPLKCLTAMIFGAIIGNIFIILIADKPLISVILAFAASSAILILTPVTNKNHPVSKKVKQRSKLIIRVSILLSLTAIIILSYFCKSTEAVTIAVTLGLYLISLMTAKIKNKRGK